MLDEARKREKVANAVLGLAFATSAAQSPKDFVKSGHIESPGVAMMQRTIGNPRRKRKDLDNPHVMSRGAKTFKEFVEESYLIEERRDTGLRGLRHGLASSKSDAISKGLRFFRGEDGRTREIRNYGSESRSTGRVVDYENETKRRAKRSKRLHDVTPPEHQDHSAYAKKAAQATKLGMDLHHMTHVARSAKIKASMSDDEWKQRLKDDKEKGIYHGNHPRNLALTKRQGETGPGISHHDTIHSPRRNNMSWEELSQKIKKVRQKARKRREEKKK